jgi:undecaprenyl-diphosphatase
VALVVTSVLLTIGIFCNKKNSSTNFKHLKGSTDTGAGRESYTVLDAIIVGVTQVCAAVFPGLSRSGSTLAAAEMRGINKQKALDYTFVLGIPSILAAALLEGVDAVKSPEGISVDPIVILVGMVVSAIVGYLSIVIFKWFLKTNKMSIFAIYTAIVGIAFIIISIIEMNTGVNLFTGALI